MAKGNDSRLGQAALLGLVGLAASAPSHAYLDPGTGSIILQSVLAGIAVALGLLRLHWYRFKSFIRSITGGTNDSKGRGGQRLARDADIQNES